MHHPYLVCILFGTIPTSFYIFNVFYFLCLLELLTTREPSYRVALFFQSSEHQAERLERGSVEVTKGSAVIKILFCKLMCYRCVNGACAHAYGSIGGT